MDRRAFFFHGNSLLLPENMPSGTENGEISIDHAANFPSADIFTIPAIENSVPHSAITGVSISIETMLPASWKAIPVRQLLSGTGRGSRMLRALHIAQWRRESRFCGSCGAPNTNHHDGTARLCPVCGRVEFPRISPAVIILITNNEGQILLAHNTKFTAGVYSLIAGFAEAGESLEAAAEREIGEEAGIAVSGIRYVASQPWPFPNSLMVGFSARYASGTVRPDGVEIEDVRWFDKNELPQIPGPGSLSHYLIGLWLEGSL